MSTTTPTQDAKVKVVSPSVLDQYHRFTNQGESKAAIGKALGIAAATVGANIKRVQGFVDDGYTLTTEEGAEVVTGTDTPSKVDPHAIAEGMAEGASIVTLRLTTLEGEVTRLRGQAEDILTRAQAQADAKVAQAQALEDTAMAKVQAVAQALGFDIDAWRAEVKAQEDTTTEVA